jgi:hypothetical protein
LSWKIKRSRKIYVYIFLCSSLQLGRTGPKYTINLRIETTISRVVEFTAVVGNRRDKRKNFVDNVKLRPGIPGVRTPIIFGRYASESLESFEISKLPGVSPIRRNIRSMPLGVSLVMSKLRDMTQGGVERARGSEFEVF